MPAKTLMVQGTMSHVGKSWLVAGLCRLLYQDGLAVCPFKSQNMALNSFVTAEGLEMGRAQALQALAAGLEPDARMNPILLKPTSHTGSQVILGGRPIGHMSAREYFAYKSQLKPAIMEAFCALSREFDAVVLEGAGSPAEINLRREDIVNMGMAQMADAPVLLVGDIDRGGVFAQLLGTLEWLDPLERGRIKGLVINKFRGDKSLLDSGIRLLEERCGIPVVGVLPYMDLQLEEEDSLGLADFFGRGKRRSKEDGHTGPALDIGVVSLPHISNYTDFHALSRWPGVELHFAKAPEELPPVAALLLPGSKNTLGDLAVLRQRGWEEYIQRRREDMLIFGICGGYQMLGMEILDPFGAEAEAGASVRGLGLLPLRTVFQREKICCQREERVNALQGPLEAMGGCLAKGYEIHMGRGLHLDGGELPLVLGSGGCYGSFLHGIFDQGEVAGAFLQAAAGMAGIEYAPKPPPEYGWQRERDLQALAACLREHMDMEAVYGILERGCRA